MAGTSAPKYCYVHVGYSYGNIFTMRLNKYCELLGHSNFQVYVYMY